MKTRAQSTIEFTFAMVVILFLAFGLVKVMSWVGMDLAERRLESDRAITRGGTPDEQLNPNFYRMKHIDAVYKGNIAR